MKKKIIPFLILISIFTSSYANNANFKSNIINKIKLTNEDIPEGFVMGKIPKFARRVLKNNPWMLDNKAIKKLTNRIYPGGNYSMIAKIHITIIAKKKNPYGDDIVCYVILYRNKNTAKNEIKKIENYVNYNRDRAIVVVEKNMVVYLHVDNYHHLHHIQDLAKNIKARIKEI